MTLQESHKIGRPNLQEEIDMKKKIMLCYIKNLTAVTASDKTGYNIKTIYKYYNEFSKIRLERINNDFVFQNNSMVVQMIASHEDSILKMSQVSDYIFYQLSKLGKKDESLPKHLFGDITKITKYITELNEKKYNLSHDLIIEDNSIQYTPTTGKRITRLLE